MDDVLKAAASQAPGLVVLVFVVTMFLKYMGKREDMIKALTDEHLAERKVQREVIEKNISATAVNTAALNNMAFVMTEINKINQFKE